MDLTGCPYCGQETLATDRVCPHCRGRLVIERPAASPFPTRIWMLAASWGGLALIYGLTDGVLWWVLTALAASQQSAGAWMYYINAYVVNIPPSPDLPLETMLSIFTLGEAIAIAWCLTMAVLLPSRRSGIYFMAGFFVLPFNGILMITQAAWGLYASLLKLAATIVVGVFLFSALGDFKWEQVRYTWGLERGLKTALDYYHRGRRYREQGMLANAILHWQQAVLLDPERVAFRIPLGNALYQAGRYREAGEHIYAALKQVPADSPQARELQQFLEHIPTRIEAEH